MWAQARQRGAPAMVSGRGCPGCWCRLRFWSSFPSTVPATSSHFIFLPSAKHPRPRAGRAEAHGGAGAAPLPAALAGKTGTASPKQARLGTCVVAALLEPLVVLQQPAAEQLLAPALGQLYVAHPVGKATERLRGVGCGHQGRAAWAESAAEQRQHALGGAASHALRAHREAGAWSPTQSSCWDHALVALAGQQSPRAPWGTTAGAPEGQARGGGRWEMGAGIPQRA